MYLPLDGKDSPTTPQSRSALGHSTPFPGATEGVPENLQNMCHKKVGNHGDNHDHEWLMIMVINMVSGSKSLVVNDHDREWVHQISA